MSVRTFRVTTRYSGRKRAVKVKVYDELSALRRAADAWTFRHGLEQPGHFGSAMGVCHAFDSVFVPDDGGEEIRGEAAALIRLWRGALGTGVVVHEVTHAASAIYQQDWEPDHGAVSDGMDNEEVLCYLVGDLTRRIVDRLYHYDMYSEKAS